MRDSPFIIALRAALTARYASIGFGDVKVKQAEQPTQQGILINRAVYVRKILDYRYGYPQRRDEYEESTNEFLHIESTQIIATYQFNAISRLNPEQDDAVTAADILKITATAIQSDVVMAILKAAGIGVLRVQNLRNVYEIDDQGRHQATPTFDAEFTYRDETVDRIPRVDTYDLNVIRV